MTGTTLCGYATVRELSPQTFLAIDDRQRSIVLKRLDESCLLQGKLHPAIVERLSRVRELSTTRIANLLGVERDDSGSYLVWQYLEGRSLSDIEAAGEPTADYWNDAAGIVRSMHRLGIVHGAVHAGNIIVDAHGSVRLTHISPLLYHDPAVDENALPVHDPGPSSTAPAKIRWRTIAAAAMAGAIGVMISVAIAWALSH